MHRNNRKQFLYNYKFINIHAYTNCLSGNNKNKITNWIRHYFKKHNIKYSDLKVIPNFICVWNNDLPVHENGCIFVNICSYSKWVIKFKLICEQNDILLTNDINVYNTIEKYYTSKNKKVNILEI